MRRGIGVEAFTFRGPEFFQQMITSRFLIVFESGKQSQRMRFQSGELNSGRIR